MHSPGILSSRRTLIFRCVNRLDRDTSGLTIIAKHVVSAAILSSMNARREIHREYRAIVRGHLTPESGVITAPLGRKDSSIIERTVDFDHGEKAVTYYQFLEEKTATALSHSGWEPDAPIRSGFI